MPPLVEETPWRWRIDPTGDMRARRRVRVQALLPDVAADQSLQQVANVATLPGIVRASYAMPDVHWGYGFPIGGVAATDVEAGGVVSPAASASDISCGVRTLLSPLTRRARPRLPALMDELWRRVPTGMGKGAVWDLGSDAELRRVLTGGPATPSRPATAPSAPRARGPRRAPRRRPRRRQRPGAAARLHQLGSLGSGNHFLEVQVVDRIEDPEAARALGLRAARCAS